MDIVVYKNVINLAPPKVKKYVGRPVSRLGPNEIKIIPSERYHNNRYYWGREKIKCEICNCYVQRRIISQHYKTNKHKKISNNNYYFEKLINNYLTK